MDEIYIKWWGAILSTILAVIKIWELYQNRTRITVSVSNNPYGDPHDIIQLTNHSNKVLLVENVSFFWSKNNNRWSKKNYNNYGEPEGVYIELVPSKRKELVIPPEDTFSWNPKNQKGKNLYIELHIIGQKRPTSLLLHKNY